MFKQLEAILAIPHKRALFQMLSIMRSFARLQFTCSFVETGVPKHLTEPRSFDDLVTVLEPAEPDLLRDLLKVGVALGELRRKGDRYRPASALARAVCDPAGAPLADMLRELSRYHGDVYQMLPERIAGAPKGDYMAQYGELIANSSRILEPFIEVFALDVVGRDTPKRILEVGCGSGIYLHHYAEAHEGHNGIGIDIDSKVVEIAKSNIASWGCADRFEVLDEDIRAPSAALDGPFDLVTSFQNVYYFTAEQRIEWFSAVRDRLAPGGVLAIASELADDAKLAPFFSLVLASTEGCYPLPTVEALEDELRAAGFSTVKRRRLFFAEAIWGLIAR